MTDSHSASGKSPTAGRHATVIELSKLGHKLFKQHRLSEAGQAFQEALALEPANPYILTGLGDVFRALKDFPAARGCYHEVLKRTPDNLFALRGLGDTCREQHLYAEAIESWQRYLALRPGDIFVLTRLAD
ncbi:MAG TPA: tetratricopeptide repeat protein, partial [Deferrimonas sp.]